MISNEHCQCAVITRTMQYLVTISFVLPMCLWNIANSQDVLSPFLPVQQLTDIQPILPFQPLGPDPIPSRYKIFAETFVNIVQSSPKLTRLFDVSVSPFDASLHMYETCKEVIGSVGLQHPEFSAKYIGDAFFQTITSMTSDVFMYAIANGVTLYLLSQGKIDLNNAASHATNLTDVLLSQYPKDEDVNHLTLLHALCSGIVHYVLGTGQYPLQTMPSLPMGVAKQFYTMTVVSEPEIEVSVIAPPGSIPSAYDVYGINSFVSSFTNAVHSSASLRSVFYSHQQSHVVADAWFAAGSTFCRQNKCVILTFSAGRLKRAILQTFNSVTRETYLRSIARAFALCMFSWGTLTPEKAEADAQNLANLMESLLNNLGPNTDLSTRIGVIFEGLRNIVPVGLLVNEQYSFFAYNLVSEFYAITNFRRPTWY